MITARTDRPDAALMSLEAAATSARSGFACVFSSSDEYETALITARRAQGRYAPPQRNWAAVLFAGVAVMMTGVALLWI